jgi:NADH-quinone oxidoreductase subunit L
MFTAILVLPLIGAIIAGFFHRFIGEKLAMVIPTTILFICCALSWYAFFNIHGNEHSISLMRFITSGDLQSDWSIRVDQLTGVMLVVVTTVSSLVHLYSIGYMAEEDGKPRFFAYLSFFTFAMLALVTGDNLLQIFFGWEGVGVSSYLLIGFWFKKPSANAAAIKAFIVNRIGDFGCSSAPWASRRSCSCTPGCRTRWRARPRSRP